MNRPASPGAPAPLATAELERSKAPLPFLLGGEWVVPRHATRRAVANPATGETIAELAYGDAAAAAGAADAAEAALPAWSALPARARCNIVGRASELLAARATAIGQVLSAETGKRVAEAVAEVRFAAEYLRWFAEEGRRPRGELLAEEDPGRRQLTLRRPIGVAAVLTPWNFPVSIPARKVAPALVAGCTLVARPSEKAPVAVLELFRALEEAGLPPGVANVVHGPAGEQAKALLAHRAVRVLSFTGSTGVGSRLMSLASARVVCCLLELGGDASFIVFSDADLDAAVEGLLLAKFRNNGQSCIAANRVLVEAPVLEELCSRLAARTEALVVGDPAAEGGCDVGPLIDGERVAAVESLVDEAIDTGARWLGGSPSVPAGPNYTRPGFLAGVPAQAGMAQSEVFGPVAGIFAFESEDEAVRAANASELGLAGYAYTSDPARQWRLAESLEIGILGLNHALPSAAYAPMGGVKQSGLGREGGSLGLEEFCDRRYVSIGL